MWLNGVRLGDAKGSRLPHEFDVSEALVEGENTLAVRVHQYSSGSYIEDQDYWRVSGIFRSVALLATPADGIRDVFVHASYAGGTGALTVDVDPPNGPAQPARARHRRRRPGRHRGPGRSSRGRTRRPACTTRR